MSGVSNYATYLMPSSANKGETCCKRWSLEMPGEAEVCESVKKIPKSCSLFSNILSILYEWDSNSHTRVSVGILVCVPVFHVLQTELTASGCTKGVRTAEVSDYS